MGNPNKRNRGSSPTFGQGKAQRQERRKVAVEKNAAYDKLTAAQKLERLDSKLGLGVGATRERALLQKQIENAKK